MQEIILNGINTPPPHTMQEKTLEDKIQTIVLMALNGAGVEEKEAEMQARVILPMIQEAISEAREEGRKEERERLAVEVDEKLREILAKELPVLKEKIITQYKEELLEKIKPLEITSQTERSLDEAVKTTWNNALSEVKKLL